MYSLAQCLCVCVREMILSSSVMLCWGKAEEGALGVGGIEEVVVTQPTRNKHLMGLGVRIVGVYPVPVVTGDGVMSCVPSSLWPRPHCVPDGHWLTALMW